MAKLMTIVIDTEIIELFRIQWWHLQCKFGIKVFDLYIKRGLFPKDMEIMRIWFANHSNYLRPDWLFQNSVHHILSNIILSYLSVCKCVKPYPFSNVLLLLCCNGNLYCNFKTKFEQTNKIFNLNCVCSQKE